MHFLTSATGPRIVPADLRVHPPFQVQFAEVYFLIATAHNRKPGGADDGRLCRTGAAVPSGCLPDMAVGQLPSMEIAGRTNNNVSSVFSECGFGVITHLSRPGSFLYMLRP